MARVRSNRVCFTINNYDEEIYKNWEEYIEKRKDDINFLIIGEEVGASGTPHLQGFLHIKDDPKKCGIKFWKAEIPGGLKAHFENAKGTDAQNLEYCTKDGPYLEFGKPTESVCRWKTIIETAKVDIAAAMMIDGEVGLKNYNQLKAINEDFSGGKMQASIAVLRDWQKKVIDLLKDQEERKILFVVDEEGGKGKSMLCKHLMTEYEAWACQGGKIGDLMYAYNADAKYVVFDMARCNNPDYYPWNFMENIKNGWFTSTKYKGKLKMFAIPKVVVFMNQMPPEGKLSNDRYHVFKI